MTKKSLVLDTHVWLWLMAGDETLSSDARLTIEGFLNKNYAMVSIVSVWEIGMLWKKGHLQLQEPLNTWLYRAADKSRIMLSAITDIEVTEATRLPNDFDAGFAANIIIATARINNSTLVTRDKRIIEYGKTGHVAVLEA